MVNVLERLWRTEEKWGDCDAYVYGTENGAIPSGKSNIVGILETVADGTVSHTVFTALQFLQQSKTTGHWDAGGCGGADGKWKRARDGQWAGENCTVDEEKGTQSYLPSTDDSWMARDREFIVGAGEGGSWWWVEAHTEAVHAHGSVGTSATLRRPPQ